MMANKYRNFLLIFLFINFGYFVYYCLLPDINPSNDAFYYMSVADSIHNGTGFYDITSVEPRPVITPQNGIVFVHEILICIGIYEPGYRFLAIKIIYYVGFICCIYFFYQIFSTFKVSSEINVLCLGIILLSAFFIKTILAPLNEGFYCFLSSLIAYLIICHNNDNNYLKIGVILFLSIASATFKLNGPLIVLSAAVAYFIINNRKLSLTYFIIFILSYVGVFALYELYRVDFSGMVSMTERSYSKEFIINKIIMIVTYTMPGIFLGISGRKVMIALPISIIIICFYLIYFKQSFIKKNFNKILIINYIILNILFLFIATGHDSRYILMILPFSLLIVATYFNNLNRLRLSLLVVLLLTFSISIFRLIFWDSVFFKNKPSFDYVRKNISEPYTLISQSSRVSYFIFAKRSDNLDKIKEGNGPIIVFGNEEYVKKTKKYISQKYKVIKTENLYKQFILAHRRDEIYNIAKIIIE